MPRFAAGSALIDVEASTNEENSTAAGQWICRRKFGIALRRRHRSLDRWLLAFIIIRERRNPHHDEPNLRQPCNGGSCRRSCQHPAIPAEFCGSFSQDPGVQIGLSPERSDALSVVL